MATLLDLPENLRQIATFSQNGNNEGLTQMMANFNGNVNAILTTEGHSALHLAVLGGHAGCVTVLLSHGSDANATMDGGNTPLHCAARVGKRTIVDSLLAAGASLTAKNSSEKTASMIAEPGTSLGLDGVDDSGTRNFSRRQAR
ncbi:unnamed protein product [Arabidopsis lyrata]|uniref:Uncharacterized protein n=1 Tax=Arabidopsis lyrata subsp. lyrata TaxID=81972 RepID=D7MJD3_ARALL|nr:hypothetical protein ARALYDRAFT_355990 [Arabidopsis lyrata subsp. lyrata]CAH8277600.1 unnamed protein product [Arabidopsis lyrata]